MSNKRGQQKLSFGMIFSIILIILFVGFASWGIYSLVSLKPEMQIEKFPNKLQEEVNEIYKSTPGQQTFSFSLPEKKIKEICFVKPENEGGDNLKLIEKREDNINRAIKTARIEHLDIESIIALSEEGKKYCIENTGEEIKLILKREENKANVIIKKQEV